MTRKLAVWEMKHEKPDVKVAHCVSADLRIGKGMAYQVLHELGNLKFNGYDLFPSSILAFYDEFTGVWIYDLVTKQRVHDKRQYHHLRQCLANLRAHVKRNQLASISLQRIACGLDKGNWNNVLNIITELLGNTQTAIKLQFQAKIKKKM